SGWISAVGFGAVFRRLGRPRCWLCMYCGRLAFVSTSGKRSARSGRLKGLSAGSTYTGSAGKPCSANLSAKISTFLVGVANPRGARGPFGLGELPVPVRRSRARGPVRHRRQPLEAHSARREQVTIACLNVAAPELCAEAQPGREVEDDCDIGPPLVERGHRGLAE